MRKIHALDYQDLFFSSPENKFLVQLEEVDEEQKWNNYVRKLSLWAEKNLIKRRVCV